MIADRAITDRQGINSAMEIGSLVEGAISACHGCKGFSLTYSPEKAMGWCASVRISGSDGSEVDVSEERESADGALKALLQKLRC